jgi:glutaredoxin
LNTQVLGISVDHVPCLKAWADSLGGISYPLLSDFWPHGEVAQKYGVLRQEGYSERAIFVIDKFGIIRYIDIHDIDDQPSNDELRRILRGLEPHLAASQPELVAPAASAPTQPIPSGGIIMYCTKWCPGCYRARRWFEARGLPFTEIDINTVPGAAEQVMKYANGNRTTPTFDIDGIIVIDWKEAEVLEALKKKGYPV